MAIPVAIPIALAAASALSNMYDSYNNAKTARDAYNDIKDQANAVNNANASDISKYRQLIQGTYGDNAAKYNQALADFLQSPVYQNEGFNYTGSVEDFMDPYANQRVDAAMNAINNSAASGGNRFSSDYISRVGAQQQAMASEEWEKAYDKLLRDRNQQLTEWQANSNNAWNNYNATNDRAKYGIDQYGNAQTQYINGMGDAYTAAMNNRNANLQTQATVAAGLANSQQGQGMMSQLLGPAASFMGSYFGGGNS